MKATIVVDNISYENIQGQWGLCVYIEYGSRKILLDTGSSDLFIENAGKLGLSIADVDYAVLSHAHYDHANGMEAFFKENSKADFYLQKNTAENCYHKNFIFSKYIGIPKGVLTRFSDRIKYVEGLYSLTDGVWLLSHSTEGLDMIGKRETMYIKEGRKWRPDNFSHEQSLIFDTDDGLVVFNSCSHGGVINIFNEVKAAFPERKVRALIGGFHLFTRSDEQIRELAKLINENEIEKIYTGHCTKNRGYRILKEELKDKCQQFRCGLELIF